MSEQIRIVSDGTAKGTKVSTASGEDITGTIRSIAIDKFGPNGLVVAKIEFINVALDVTALGDSVERIAFVAPPAPMPDKGGLVGGKSSWAWPWK